MRNQSADYFQMNAGAHRRSATNFNAPALIWHRAFWIDVPSSKDYPDWDVTALEAARKQARICKKNKIDEFIIALHRFVSTPGKISQNPKSEIHPSVGDKIILFNSVIDRSSCQKIGELGTGEEDVLDSDSRVVTMEFDWAGIAVTARIELYTEYFSVTTFAELGSVANAMTEYGELVAYLAGANKPLGKADADKADRLRETLFHKFWDDRADRMARDESLANAVRRGTFNNLFADFRGLVISNETCKLQHKPDFGESEELSWGKQIDFKLLPLFTQIKRFECTACYMLDGRALYVSTLGPQLPEAGDGDMLPLQYIFYVHQSDRNHSGQTIVSKWQLGRLIDSIHHLGTVRLAALKYLPKLRDAGTSLSGLDGYLKKVRSDLTGGISIPDLLQAHKHLANLTTQFNQTTRTDTGILYRIERARYYIEQYKANIEPLRIRRLEGYQRYDEFVRHRLGPVFDFIDRLGARLERAVNILSLFDQYNASVRTQLIDEDIRKGQDDSRRIQAEIRKIQIYGEAVLGGVLVPYYLTALADHVVKHNAIFFIAIGLFALGLGYAFFRIADFKELGRLGRFLAVVAAFLLVGLLVLILYVSDAIQPPEATAAVATKPGAGLNAQTSPGANVPPAARKP